MNQEELALFIELQPRLLEYRGEWQVGDKYYCSRQAESDSDGIKYIEHAEWINGKLEAIKPEPCCPDIAIWLPLSIDPADPERIARGEKPRGLWGMVDGNFTVEQYGSGCQVTVYMPDNYANCYSRGTSTLALLRALKAQWE